MNAAFQQWLDAFFDAYFRQRPVNATFIGVHAYDDCLPDLSTAGQADIAATADRLLDELKQVPLEPRADGEDGCQGGDASGASAGGSLIPIEPGGRAPLKRLTLAEWLDWQLAEGFLEIARWEARSAHFAWGNPSVFTGEAVFGVLSLLLRPFAPVEERLELAAARAAAIPRLLDDGRAVLHDAPRAWCARARRECAGARLLFASGVDRLLADEPTSGPVLRRAADNALEAVARFDAFVAEELEPKATDAYACGAEVFDLLLRRAHFLDVDAAELERLALERMAEEQAAIATASPGRSPAPSSGPTPGDAQHQAGERYLARFEELWRAARDLAETNDLLTFPDWPVRYVEMPNWVREAAPYFYFLPYRSPAPYDATPFVDYYAPDNADDSTIKLNHVIHHGSLGHHVQNWHAARAESRIGRMAAVDCASRIAMLCGGTMAEGWACYATDLAQEAGFLTPAERFAQHAARLRMAARALVDIRLHQGRISLDEAAGVYIERVGMTRDGAMAEAVKNSLFPGGACMYLAGWDAIRRITHGVSRSVFNDQLLSMGSVPVALALKGGINGYASS